MRNFFIPKSRVPHFHSSICFHFAATSAPAVAVELCAIWRDLRTALLLQSVIPRCVWHNRYAFTAAWQCKDSVSPVLGTRCVARDKPTPTITPPCFALGVRWTHIVRLRPRRVVTFLGPVNQFPYLLIYLRRTTLLYTAVIFWLSLYCAICQLMLLLLLLLAPLMSCPHHYTAPRRPEAAWLIPLLRLFFIRPFITLSRMDRPRNYSSLAFVLRRSSSARGRRQDVQRVSARWWPT